MSDVATLLEGGSFFEGPRWHDGRWWVSDFYRDVGSAYSSSAKPISPTYGRPFRSASIATHGRRTLSFALTPT